MKTRSLFQSRGVAGLLVLAGGFGIAWVVGEGDRIEPVQPSQARVAAEPVVAKGLQASPDQALVRVVEGQTSARAGSEPKARSTVETDRRAVTLSRAEAGWRLAKEGYYQRAAQVFTEAAELFPDDASFLVGLGLCQHRLSKNDLAVSTLERAIRLDPSVGQAHKLLGDVYYRRGEVQAAIRHYETARQQDPNDVTLQARLVRAQSELQAESGFDRLYSSHFVVKFEGSTDRRKAHEVANRLEMVYNKIGRTFSYFPVEPFTVILHPDRHFQEATLGPGWAGGLFDGKIHLPVQRITKDQQAGGRILSHEYTHAVIDRMSGGHAPVWLSEGLALHLEGKADSWGREVLARHAAEIAPLNSLHGDFLELPPHRATVAYAQSYQATKVLIRRYGMDHVRRLLETLSATPEFSSAFEAVLHDRYSDFDAAWIAGQAKQRS
ncbi:MAG TPA: tetratricopeptide repeat protein [Nitrospiraceae bacterium]|nr:tetratricopeptide repeat protein [Nitrospiraceae bacterium]